MKALKYSLISLLLLGKLSLLEAQTNKKPETKKKKVEKQNAPVTILKPEKIDLYRNGVQIQFSAEVSLIKGKQTFILEGFNEYIKEDNLIFKNNPSVQLLKIKSISSQIPKSESNEVQNLENKLEKYLIESKAQKHYFELLNQLSTHKTVNLKELKSYPVELAKTEARLKYLERRITDFQFQLEELRYSTQQENYNRAYQVDVLAKVAGKQKLSFLYTNENSFWQSRFRVYVDSKRNLATIYKEAIIHQKSHVTWRNVRLNLIDSEIQNYVVLPTLGVWQIDLEEENKPRRFLEKMSALQMPSAQNISDIVVNREVFHMKTFTLENFDLVTSDLPTTIAYETINVPITLDYYVVPQKDNRPIIRAKFNTSRSPILVGEAFLFLDDKLVRKSFVDFYSLINMEEQTIALPLDYDPNIQVDYDEVPQMRQTNFLGTIKSTFHEYVLSVTSLYNKPIDLNVDLNIPVSNDENIKVEFIPDPSVKYNKKNGQLNYNLKLLPESNQVRKIRYNISLPKDQNYLNIK